MGRVVVLTIVLLLSAVSVRGQQAPRQPSALEASEPIRFRHVTAEALAERSVSSITQDALGFLWFGAIDGLKRYDGREVRVFKSHAFDRTSLRHPWVFGMVPDEEGGLWLATEGGGLNRYDATTESFAHVRFPEAAHISDDLLRLLQARDGTLWVGTRYDGLYHYDPRTGQVTAYRQNAGDPNGLHDGRVTALLEDRAGRLWIGTGIGGLHRLDPQTGAWHRYHHDAADPASLSSDRVRALLEDRNGHVWIGTEGGGLSRYRSATDDFVRYRHDPADPHSLGEDAVYALLEDPEGALWLGTADGLGRLDPATGRFDHFRHDPADPMSLQPGSTGPLYLDRTGIFWVATASGVSYFTWEAPAFQHITHRPGEALSLDHPDVWAVYEDRAGVLWVSTVAGLNRVDRATGRVTRYPVHSDDPAGLMGGTVQGIYEDRAGNFWVGTRFGALHRFDRTTGRVVERFAEVPGDTTSLLNDTPWGFHEDRRGHLWITNGGRGCLNRMDLASRTFRRFCHDPTDPNTPAHDIAHDIVEDASGALWLGTWGAGLDRFDPATGTFTHYRHDPTDRNTPASDFIFTLHQDTGGYLWLGFFGAGLDRFDPVTGTFTHFSEANSDLPSDVVFAIEEDDAGDLWISTYRGLSRFSPSTGRFRTYGLEDGLQALEFNVATSFRSPRGELFFGGINGVNAFFPDRIEDDPTPPPVVLTGLQIRGQPAVPGADGPLPRALPFVDALTLRHDQHDVALTFAALHFADPARNRFRYRLEGYDDAWHLPGPAHSATYTNLDPGRYTFRVQAANSDGVWNEEGATLRLHILPPWWQTWWAYALYALAALGAGLVLHRYRRNRLALRHRLELERVEAEKLRELNRAKNEFFANVSHEFRTPLTLTLGPLDDLRAGLYGPLSAAMMEQVDLARRNAARVLDLINQILELARLEAGQAPLRAQRLDLGAFVQDLAGSFQSLADRKALAFDVHRPSEALVVYADPGHLYKVLSNLLSNAFKFTPDGGAVRVRVEDGAEGACVVIRDSGPGIPAEDLAQIFDRFYRAEASSTRIQAGTGIGLALARELVSLHGGSLTVESEEGFGSTFTIVLPHGRAHLAPEQIVENAGPPPIPEARALPLPALPSGDGQAAPGAEAWPGDMVADDDVTTVLVVEDHAEVRAYVRRHLEAAYRVIEASTGEEGLAAARALLPDLVLSDVMMPGLDGLSLCRALKADPETDFIPVILLTAKATTEDRIEGLGEQADDYLTKPFQMAELRARIDNLIASRRRLRERFRQEGAAEEPAPALPALRPRDVEPPSADAVFLERVREVAEAHLGDETFTVDRFAEDAGLSRSQLHRRLRDLLGQSPSEVIRTMRLARAAQLLEARAGSVSEVAYAVGFKSVSHFSNAFLEHYGCRPSAYPAEARG